MISVDCLPSSTGLAPLRAAFDGIRARHGASRVHGVAPGIVVDDAHGWVPASHLADGAALPELLAAARLRWPGDPHVAAALAWKSYAYWVTLPVVVGYAGAGRVPMFTAANTLFRVHGEHPFVTVGLARPEVTVRADDPAGGGTRSVPDTPAMLAALRATLLDEHLAPVLERIHATHRLGRRSLLGSVASAVCQAALRAADLLPGPLEPMVTAILDALGVADLVEFGPDAAGVLRVQRRTCCLAFALQEPKSCAGCCVPAGQLARHREPG